MRFHVLGVPHTVTNKEYVGCAYTQKILKFCSMMTSLGHHVFHYGHEDSEVDAYEHITVLKNEDLLKAYGNYDWKKSFFKFDIKDHAYQTFYKNAIEEIEKRKRRLDFILPFWGHGHRPICDHHNDIICVEPGIGYASGHFAKYKVFESYAIYHAYCGLESVSSCRQNWHDVVIPNYFDLKDFTFEESKDDYFLFLGRVYEGKGVNIAVQVTEKLGKKLIVAGQGCLKDMGYKNIPPHVIEVGYADVEKRRLLMSKACAAFVQSMYVEPFGGVQIECLLSGTPTITTDWGAFAENNIHGYTGFRCRNFQEFLWAAKNINQISPKNCRDFAEKRFSTSVVSKLYENYFNSILDIYLGDGWYQTKEDFSINNFQRPTNV